MPTTEWPDVSEHQEKGADNSMTRPWFAFRANDGTYRDPLFLINDIWSRKRRQLVGYIIYNVWPRSIGHSTWEASFAAFKGMIGIRHRPRLVIMDDVESWNRGELRKDFSVELEAKRKAEVAYLNSLRPRWQRVRPWRAVYLRRDNRRVIGYGNRGDLQTMAAHVNWPTIVLADYSSASTPKTFMHWRVIARQYTNAGRQAPWAKCDMNRAEIGPRALARALGLGVFRWRAR